MLTVRNETACLALSMKGNPMKYTPPMVLAVLLLIACSNNSAEPDLEADAGADAAVRTCDQGVIATTLNQPPCTWEWTCSDFTDFSGDASAAATSTWARICPPNTRW